MSEDSIEKEVAAEAIPEVAQHFDGEFPIVIEGLRNSFGSQVVHEGLDLKVRRGEVLGVLALWTLLLQRSRFGRYIYAIGGNAEAARRAGINVKAIRTWAFILCATTAGVGGLLYASYLGGMSNNVDSGLVLFAVASAVITVV